MGPIEESINKGAEGKALLHATAKRRRYEAKADKWRQTEYALLRHVAKCVWRLKVGDRVRFKSSAGRGLPAGEFYLSGIAPEVKDGKVLVWAELCHPTKRGQMPKDPARTRLESCYRIDMLEKVLEAETKSQPLKPE